MGFLALLILIAGDLCAADFPAAVLKQAQNHPGYSRHIVAREGSCAAILEQHQSKASSNPFEDRKAISGRVRWVNQTGREIGSLAISKRVRLEAISDSCENTVLVDEGFDVAELGSGAYVDPEWDRTGVRNTGTLKRNPDLRDSFVIIVSSAGQMVSKFRTRFFPKVAISPNGDWVLYGEDIPYETTIFLANVRSGAISQVENLGFAGLSVSNDGRLVGAMAVPEALRRKRK